MRPGAAAHASPSGSPTGAEHAWSSRPTRVQREAPTKCSTARDGPWRARRTSRLPRLPIKTRADGLSTANGQLIEIDIIEHFTTARWRRSALPAVHARGLDRDHRRLLEAWNAKATAACSGIRAPTSTSAADAAPTAPTACRQGRAGVLGSGPSWRATECSIAGRRPEPRGVRRPHRLTGLAYQRRATAPLTVSARRRATRRSRPGLFTLRSHCEHRRVIAR